MAFYKVPSLMHGGLFWFTDLTTSDPYFILPLLTAVSLHTVIRVGAEFGGSLESQPLFMQRVLLYGIPIGTLIFMSNFPAALNFYWLTNNLISLLQVFIITRPAIREKLNLPPKSDKAMEAIKHTRLMMQMLDNVRKGKVLANVAQRAAASKLPPQSPTRMRGDVKTSDRTLDRTLADKIKEMK